MIQELNALGVGSWQQQWGAVGDDMKFRAVGGGMCSLNKEGKNKVQSGNKAQEAAYPELVVPGC